MHSHDIDASYLNGLYNFWSNLLFGEDKTESATGSQKPADEGKPAETTPEAPTASSSYNAETLSTNAGAAGFSPGAAIYYGNSQAVLAKHSIPFKVLNLAATFLAGFLNVFTGKDSPVTEPPTYTNYAISCNPVSIPPENIELRHKPLRDQVSPDCAYTTAKTSMPKTHAPEKADCRAAYIPFEAIEYRYGTATGGIMHLPICKKN
jgi:hypothetical protein